VDGVEVIYLEFKNPSFISLVERLFLASRAMTKFSLPLYHEALESRREYNSRKIKNGLVFNTQIFCPFWCLSSFPIDQLLPWGCGFIA